MNKLFKYDTQVMGNPLCNDAMLLLNGKYNYKERSRYTSLLLKNKREIGQPVY